jgi:hypothetical protein
VRRSEASGNGPKHYKIVSCEVFSRLIYSAAAHTPNVVDVEFTELRSHVDPDALRREIQGIIDRTSDKYDAILLGYGLCGNSTSGLKARSVPLVIPRAHDCCTIFLGSKAAFMEHFGSNPSAQWSSACYYERLGGFYQGGAAGMMEGDQDVYYRELVEKYGEENADYIIEMMKVKNEVDFLTYIELDGFDRPDILESFRRHAVGAGKLARLVRGSTRLIDALVGGEWDDGEFLVVPPGSEIMPVYDHDRVIEKIIRHC